MILKAVSHQLQIRLLGEFQMLHNEQTVAGLYADRPQSLLAYLLLHRGIPQPRRHLAFLLWPDSTEGQARTNLRNLLHGLRQIVPDSDSYILADLTTIQWQTEIDFDLDVARFEAALDEAARADNPALTQHCLETAVSLYQGDLLPGNYDDWIIPIREELRQRYLAALRQLVTLLKEQESYHLAARYCQRLILQDPFDESAALQLMHIQALSGDRASVRRTYQMLATTLRRELGVEPALATQETYAQLLRIESAAPQPLPAMAVLPEWQPRPLPIPGTPFVGRETELAEIGQRLLDPTCRLMTILGLGGMGKTRLALQIAINNQENFPDGAGFAALAGLQNADLLASAVADALQFRFTSSANPAQQLFHFLSQRKMLLILDNFEHLLSTATGSEYGGEHWLADLLQAAPKTKIIVTSRQRLDLQEEWIFEIQGMKLPQITSNARLTDNSAVTLFCQSALRVDGHFEFSTENLEHVAHICHLVGGMPLGIELAASWVRTLSCAEISLEIERGLSFLQSGARNMPLRHRSMQAVFDHSWQLLSDEEQRLMARLSVFRGGFSREAAMQVAGTDLAMLSALVDKSLLQRTVAGRFTLHELVRQYATAHLQRSAEAAQDVRRQHAEFYLTLLQTHESELQSPQQNDALTALMTDIDNIRIAWDEAVASGSFALLRRAAYPLWYLYELRNYFQEGEARTARTAEVVERYLNQTDLDKQSSEHQELTALLGELWAYLGFFNIHLGNGQAAFELTTAAVDRLKSVNIARAPAYALCLHVMVLRTKSQYDEAMQLCQRGLQLSRAEGLKWQEAIFLATIGAAAHDLGDYAKAYRYLNEAFTTSREIGDPRHIAYIGNLLSRTVQILGRPSEAESLLQEIMMLSTKSEDRLGIGMALEQLARIAQNAGDDEKAHTLFEECVAMYTQSGDIFHLSQALSQYGQFLFKKGSFEQANAALIQACQIGDPMGAYVPVLDALAGLAALYHHTGERERALEVLCYVREHPDSSSEAQKQAAQLWEEVVQTVSPAQVCAVQEAVKQYPFTIWLREKLLGNRRWMRKQLTRTAAL